MSAAANSFDSCQAAQLMHVVRCQPIMFLLGSGKLQHCCPICSHTHTCTHTTRTVTYLVVMCCKPGRKGRDNDSGAGMRPNLCLIPAPKCFRRPSALHMHVQLRCKVMLHRGLSERLAALQGCSWKDYSSQDKAIQVADPSGLHKPTDTSPPCIVIVTMTSSGAGRTPYFFYSGKTKIPRNVV